MRPSVHDRDRHGYSCRRPCCVSSPGCEPRLEVAAPTVGAMLDELDRRYPGMRDRLRDTTPAIRRHISVVVEGSRAKLDTPLTPGTRVYVLTAISGG